MLDPIMLSKAFPCAFFAACFLQSSLDKVVDWKGNMDWLVHHFAKTPMKGAVPIMLGLLTLLEFSTGAVCLVATVTVLMHGAQMIPVLAMGLACFTLFCLFTGQRIAKDYAGAASLAAYSAVALVGLYLQSQR